ncbi:DNA repair protein complementing XP-A cells homolog [Ostrea edulis]|uniref:DNA repair protein complementing XP-A cells homolog n=1 Tax=Ostrea edulis TaxID=37623 RepID=UPI0024AF9AFF|nr:DNA repair protein complementing XP-A cells homolog [Ostrea edulis]
MSEESGPSSACNSSTDQSTEAAEIKLTAAQRARVERNRQRALLLRQARLAKKPYTATESKQKVTRTIDTGAGFFLEEEDEEEDKSRKTEVKHPLGPVIECDALVCEDCGKEFLDSWLLTTYNVNVCDVCKEDTDKHLLVTKTEAKDRYLLKDSDLEIRDPPLKFIIRKNPRNPRWGDMKLYYEPQVYDRAMEVWGSEEGLEKAHDERSDKREKVKRKKFDKKVKELRLAVRSSLVKVNSGPHEHEYGPETYDEESDMYSVTCECGHVRTYEKM